MLFKQEYIFFSNPQDRFIQLCVILFLFIWDKIQDKERYIGSNITSVIQFCFEFSTKIVTIINDFTGT